MEYPDYPIDVDATEERLYELYVINCERNGLTPTLKDYTVWLEENYE